MITVNAGNITKGMYLIYKGKPHLVVKGEFMSPGKGATIMRVKFKSIETGSAAEFTYRTNEQVEVADVTKTEMEFLYRSGSELVFMNPVSFDQASVAVSLIEDQVGFLMPNMKCWVLWYKDEAIGVALPPNVTMKVVESPEGAAGNTINAPKKLVKVETGIEVMVPIFIKEGEKIIIDTVTGEYIGRTK